MHRHPGELVISDSAESLSAKRSGALKLLAVVTRTSLLVGMPLAVMTEALIIHLNPEASLRLIVTILMIPLIGPLLALSSTFPWYFATTLRLSSEGLMTSLLGGTTMVRWTRVARYSIKPTPYIPGFSTLSMRLGFGSRSYVLIPTECSTEIDKFIRRWTHA